MSDDIQRFENRPTTFVGVLGPDVVYVGIANRSDFDKLDLPVKDHQGEQGHVLTKTLGDLSPGKVTVIFQHWIKSLTVDALIADAEAKRAAVTSA